MHVLHLDPMRNPSIASSKRRGGGSGHLHAALHIKSPDMDTQAQHEMDSASTSGQKEGDADAGAASSPVDAELDPEAATPTEDSPPDTSAPESEAALPETSVTMATDPTPGFSGIQRTLTHTVCELNKVIIPASNESVVLELRSWNFKCRASLDQGSFIL
jgi:hypothetical protein